MVGVASPSPAVGVRVRARGAAGRSRLISHLLRPRSPKGADGGMGGRAAASLELVHAGAAEVGAV